MADIPAPRLARRMAGIEPFHVMALLARARELEAGGRDIVHMEIGEPDFPTPGPIVEAGRAALAGGAHHYTPAAGLPALREAIAAFYGERYGAAVEPGRIIVTPGSSGALQLLMAALIDVGEAVVMADPGYPCNRHFVRLMEGVARAVPVGPERGYQLDAESVARHWDDTTRAVLIASPSNPTGTLVAPGELERIAALAEARGGHLLVDEIYHGLVYDGPAHPPTAAALEGPVFVVNSFSKFFGMTGWRLGWLVAPPEYVEPLERLAQNLFLAPSTPAQHAALAAFRPGTLELLERRREEFGRRRDFLLPALESLGFRFRARPQGAFYLYADAGALCDDSFAFCTDLLERAGVAVTPGRDFGSHGAATHLRFAYTTALERLEEGVERIARFLGA